MDGALPSTWGTRDHLWVAAVPWGTVGPSVGTPKILHMAKTSRPAVYGGRASRRSAVRVRASSLQFPREPGLGWPGRNWSARQAEENRRAKELAKEEVY